MITISGLINYGPHVLMVYLWLLGLFIVLAVASVDVNKLKEIMWCDVSVDN